MPPQMTCAPCGDATWTGQSMRAATAPGLDVLATPAGPRPAAVGVRFAASAVALEAARKLASRLGAVGSSLGPTASLDPLGALPEALVASGRSPNANRGRAAPS